MVEPPEDMHAGRLAGAGGPHDGHALAPADGQVDVAQDLYPVLARPKLFFSPLTSIRAYGIHS